MNRLLIGAVAAAIVATSAFAQDVPRLFVIDGDTVARGPERYRLQSIDTPETEKPRCRAEYIKGKQATRRLRDLIARAWEVRLVESGQRDKYGRHLATLLLDGQDVGETLMSEGLAVPWQPGPAAWEERRQHWCGW